MLKDNAQREPLPFGKPSKSFNIQGFLQRYGILVLVIGSFLFALTVPIVLLVSKPNYEVHSLMRIDPVIPSLITTSEDPSIINYYQDYANTQARRMMDFEVLKKTVEKLSPEEKAAILPARLPADKCASILPFIIKVNTVSGTHLIDISASSPKKAGLAPLVNNFMNVFLEKVRRGNAMQDNERLVYLRSERETLKQQIASIEGKLDTLTNEIATADFSETYNLAAKKTEGLQSAYIGALAAQIESNNSYLETTKAGRELKALTLNPLVEERVMSNQSLDFTTSWTYQQQQQMRSTTDGLTANNPDRIYVEQRMKAMQSYEKKLQNEVRNTAKEIIYGKRDYDLRRESILAKNKSEKSEKTEAELLKELEESKKEAIRISIGLHHGESLTAVLRHNRDLLDRIDTRIHELEVEGKAPLRISIESSAREPDEPIGTNTQKLLLTFFGLAFGSVGAVFLAFDLFDNRIRRPEEIRLALGYPPAQSITRAKASVPLHRLIDLAPDDAASKAIRSLAVRLNREKRNMNSAEIILFTGVESGTGTSTLAFNTAQALGRIVPKVLMIEGDFDTPALSLLTRPERIPSGLGDYLRSEAPLSDYIVKSEEYTTDIIYAGHTLQGNTPRHRIPELLEELRRRYDFVCIDSRPLLDSDLTELFALSSDIVALVCLGESTMYRDLRRAAELLIHLEVPAIAPLLNHGGNKRTLSIDKLLEKQPGFLHKIDTRKLETFIQQLPPVGRIIDTIGKTAGKGWKKKQKTAYQEPQS